MNPVVEEIEKIRSVRRRICESLDNNPRRLLDHYIQLEQKLKQQPGFVCLLLSRVNLLSFAHIGLPLNIES